MTRDRYLIVTAGGSGTRMGAALPKQFLELAGVPILHRTVALFQEAVPGINIITVLPADHLAAWRRYCQHAVLLPPQRLVQGGFTRFHSVKNALQHVPDGVFVAVHDGVRPLLSVEKIREMFDRMETVRALIPVVPMVDTLKVLDKAEDGTLLTGEGSLDRSRVYGAQTPQIFRSEDLKAAYQQGYDTAFTDDASVAQKYGIPLSYIAGERYNIKITEPADLALAEAVYSLSRRE